MDLGHCALVGFQGHHSLVFELLSGGEIGACHLKGCFRTFIPALGDDLLFTEFFRPYKVQTALIQCGAPCLHLGLFCGNSCHKLLFRLPRSGKGSLHGRYPFFLGHDLSVGFSKPPFLRLERCISLIHSFLKRFRIESGQEIAGFYLLVVTYQYLDHSPGNPGADHVDRSFHKGVVCGDVGLGVSSVEEKYNKPHGDNGTDDHERPHFLAVASSLLIFRCFHFSSPVSVFKESSAVIALDME